MSGEKFDVGGVLLDRPFKVQRLGHLALCVDDQEASLRFYSDLLGMNVSDTVDFAAMFDRQTPGRDGNVYFLHLASDHHSTVLFPRWTMPPRKIGVGTEFVSHLAWQVGTMSQVLEGGEWLRNRHESVRPGSRDPAGANYNATVYDPNTLPNEIYYGMDQIGWSGLSKPPAIWPEDDSPLPDVGNAIDADFPSVRKAIENGLSLREGLHRRPWPDEQFNVDGVVLPRPFRVINNAPVAIFVQDMAQSLQFYSENLGLVLTATVDFDGFPCHFLRANTEHHTLVLLPAEIRGKLGLHPESICAYYGLQVQTYRQLRDAISYLEQRGVEIRQLPRALTPGMDYSALAMAPDGHAVLLYYQIEQIGTTMKTDGNQSFASLPPDEWPEVLPGNKDSYTGFIFQGPIG